MHRGSRAVKCLPDPVNVHYLGIKFVQTLIFHVERFMWLLFTLNSTLKYAICVGIYVIASIPLTDNENELVI